MLIDAHVHIFPKVDGYGPKGHTHGAGYGRIDFGDGVAQDVLPAINESTSNTLMSLGDTPGILLAWAIVSGSIFTNFWRASVDSD